MAEVIDLSRRTSKQRRIDQGRQRRKAEAVAAAMSCGICPRRCAFCGQGVEEPQPPLVKVPYPLCASCHDEATAFLRREEGLADDVFWHTEQWAAMWRGWLAFMEAAGKFRGAPEFLRLMQEYSQ